ncbi:Hydroxyacylglutathione hydrolase [Rhodovastum atsumiense]|uniref:NAD(P)-binding protein n=1 Tax=Rhodovastum atsumiense TaxID=504468 RepID=A0A5M6ITD9_9PROT|nr:FAD/NAD(P)-binding protein [Rhodovastum atsumiense]KAA5611481.1 NAD(P)-binding protein [Rhodovastum atsumiense]CAH2601173.1 Hydroxyacylglutathione hydrolase [Rhodovastum atsumiense]
MSGPTIAIVGAGFSGTLLALHILRRCPPPTRVTLIERSRSFGSGLAYARRNAGHLLNVPAGRMSAFHDRPADFLHWLQRQPVGELGDLEPTERTFVPRRLFGGYVRALLNDERKRPENETRLDLLRGDVLAIEKDPAGHRLRLDRDREVIADLAILAIGNFPPDPPPVDDPSFYDGPLYRPDPWAADTLTELDPDAPVLLIGTGLTMVDTVVALLDQGHRAPIHALSRRGLLPQRHAAAPALPFPHDPFPTRLIALLRLLRRDATRAMAAGGSWQPVVDELRPFTLDIWQALSAADRARFLRHLRPWWDVHRHRSAPVIAERIDAARASGQLRIHAGRIQAYDSQDGSVVVSFRPRAGDGLERLRASRVVNCSGPCCDFDRIADPLVRALLEDGLVRPDPLRLGLEVTTNCAVRDRDGGISPRLFAVGPVTRGMFWEMTAVPDLRRQCEALATHLAMLVPRLRQG